MSIDEEGVVGTSAEGDRHASMGIAMESKVSNVGEIEVLENGRHDNPLTIGKVAMSVVET